MTRELRTVRVPVSGGDLNVGIWDADAPDAPSIVAIHGVTSSLHAWDAVAEALPGVRLIAPDLRGRGRSNELDGPAGMKSHADDLAALFAAEGLGPTVVVGHSMGGFVAARFAAEYPELVSRLVLVDGGLPLAAPEGLDAEQLVAAILGPTAARLNMRFADVQAYLDFWRAHPAFADGWRPELDAYFRYDLVPDGDGLRPATSYATTVEDTIDMNTSTGIVDALDALACPTVFVTVPRGLQDEPPGLYPEAQLDELLPRHPHIVHERWPGLNHYTVVMAPEGAERVAALLTDQLTLAQEASAQTA